MPLPLAARAVSDLTSADLAARYLGEYVAVCVKPKTAANARTAVHHHLLPALGRLPLKAVV